MKNTLNINTGSIEDRNILMGILYSVGAVFHLKSQPGHYTLERAKDAFRSNLMLSVERTDEGLDICGWNTVADVNFTTDPAKAIELIKAFAANKVESIHIEDVGDYSADVKPDGIHIYNQVISFTKFDEIAAAITKFKSLQ